MLVVSLELVAEMLQLIDRLQQNDDVTSIQLHEVLKDRGHNKSRSTVIRVQSNDGCITTTDL